MRDEDLTAISENEAGISTRSFPLELSFFWCYYSTKEKYVGQKYSPKNKYFFASFNNDRRLSLEDKTKDVDRNTRGQVHELHEVTQLG